MTTFVNAPARHEISCPAMGRTGVRPRARLAQLNIQSNWANVVGLELALYRFHGKAYERLGGSSSGPFLLEASVR
jgi:hypothetical protein